MEWYPQINGKYNNNKPIAERIQATFQPIDPAVRQTLFNHIAQFWQIADVRFELVEDPEQADVRVGLSDYTNINFAPAALPYPGREQLGQIGKSTNP